MLTDKQQRFVEEYIVDRNATQAAIRAGYEAANADVTGPRLLGNVGIAEAIAAASQEQSARTAITADRVIEEMEAMALWDPADLVEVAIEVSPGQFQVQAITEPSHIKLLPAKIRRAIVGWSWDRNGNFTLKLADKKGSIDQLARHLGLYNDQIDVNITNGLAERIARARQRRRQDEAGDTQVEARAVKMVPQDAPDEPDAGLADRLRRAKGRSG